MTQYVLVLRLACGELAFDRLIEVEDALSSHLHGFGDVDGHDIGGGWMNIFIFTRQPQAAFERALWVVKAANLLNGFAAAYRSGEDENERYVRLWPLNTSEAFELL